MEQIWKLIAENKVIQAILFALAIWLIYLVRVPLILFFFSFIIMAGLRPLTDRLENLGFPKIISIFLPYFGITAIFVILGIRFIPPAYQQIGQLSANLETYADKASHFLAAQGLPIGNIGSVISDFLKSLEGTLINIPKFIAKGLVSFFAVIVISIYLLWDPRYIPNFLGLNQKYHYQKIYLEVESRMGRWLRGQLILSFIVGALSGIGLFFLGVNYAVILGFLAGVFELVPYFGPIASALIAMLVAANISFSKVLLVAALFIVIQQLENHLLVPQIMRRSVDLHPVTIIVSILIGTELIGLIGTIIAVPFAVMISIVWHYAGSRHSNSRDKQPAS